MEKRAETDHPIHDLLARRWSPRVFDTRPIPHEVLSQIFEAARWASSSFNEQPWRYLVGLKDEDPEQFDRLASALLPGNAWAKSAPVLALSVAKNTFTHNEAPNRVAVHDVGAASANLTIEALDLGVFVHQMGGFDVEKARQELAVPPGFEPVAMLALGYPADPEKLSPEIRTREESERKRKKLGEFVFRGNWGERPF